MWLTMLCAFLIFTIGPTLLNQLVHYSITGGGPAEKFHPATYVAVALLVLVLADAARAGRGLDVRLTVNIGMFAILSAMIGAAGNGAYAAIIMDIYVTPGILLLAMSRSDSRQSRNVLRVFVWATVVSALVVFVECWLQQPLFSIERGDAVFRPAGLSGHPIMAGTVFYCALFLVMNEFVDVPMRRTVALLLLVAVALCGVRGPLAAAGLIWTIGCVKQLGKQKNMSARMADAGAMLLLPAVSVFVYWGGGFDRVVAAGLWDGSAQSRFYVFDVLNLLTRSELWSGVGSDVARTLTSQVAGTESTENFVVLAVLVTGAPFACALTVAVVIFFWPAIRRSPMFALMFILISVTTLGLGVKNQIPAAVALTAYAILRLRPAQMTQESIARARSAVAAPAVGAGAHRRLRIDDSRSLPSC